MSKKWVLAAVAAVASISVHASVTFDASTGTGFVGKGDVQSLYGWNNAGLQANAASVQFAAFGTSVVRWECTNAKNAHVMVRERVTTGGGLLVHEVRLNPQEGATGFPLLGYAAGVTTPTTDGPALNSCPASENPRQPSPWSLTRPASAASMTGATLQVSLDGITWTPLPIGE